MPDLIHSIIDQLVEQNGASQFISAVLDNAAVANCLRNNEHYFEIRTVEPDGSGWTQKCVLISRDCQLVGHSAKNRPVG